MSIGCAPATGGDILSRQNGPRHRLLLAAFSTVYGQAKTILAIQVIATVGGAVVASVVSTHWPAIRSWTVLYAVAVSLLDTFVLERMQARCRRLGSQLQELFDGELFGLAWNGYAAGDPPSAEVIAEEGEAFLKKQPATEWLQDWYPAEIARLPLDYAALVCQRTNCWWDQRLRRRYLVGLVTGLVVLAGGLTAYGLARQVTFEQFFLSILAPLWPALVWGVREAFKQRDAAESAGNLQGQVENLWARCLRQPLPADQLRWEMRAIQTEIHRGRASRPLVFNWVHRLFRSRHQQLMKTGAADMAVRLAAQAPGG